MQKLFWQGLLQGEQSKCSPQGRSKHGDGEQLGYGQEQLKGGQLVCHEP